MLRVRVGKAEKRLGTNALKTACIIAALLPRHKRNYQTFCANHSAGYTPKICLCLRCPILLIQCRL